MSAPVALSFEGVWKRYDREHARRATLKQAFLDPLGRFRHNWFWALSDVDLTIREGETIGLVGANGAGKSTLLRLAAGLGRPTTGKIRTLRRTHSILTLGDAFDPTLSGRENAISAAIVAGFTRRQVAQKLDEIVAFAELEEFIGQPLRTYSTGMQLRLAFAVAVSVEPEILVIDEVLSVGDMRFQGKCFDRLREFQAAGATILLASHDESQVRRLCNRALWLQRGRVQADGVPEQVFEAYRLSMRAETERRLEALPDGVATHEPGGTAPERRFGTREVEISALRVHPDEVLAGAPDGGAPTFVELTLAPRVAVEEPIVALSVHRSSDGLKVLDVSTAGDRMLLGRIDAPTTVRLRLDYLGLEPGSYYLDVGVYERDWTYVYDFQPQACSLHVRSATGGSFGPPREWSIS